MKKLPSRSRKRLRYGMLSNKGRVVSFDRPTMERTLFINDEGRSRRLSIVARLQYRSIPMYRAKKKSNSVLLVPLI